MILEPSTAPLNRPCRGPGLKKASAWSPESRATGPRSELFGHVETFFCWIVLVLYSLKMYYLVYIV